MFFFYPVSATIFTVSQVLILHSYIKNHNTFRPVQVAFCWCLIKNVGRYVTWWPVLCNLLLKYSSSCLALWYGTLITLRVRWVLVTMFSLSCATGECQKVGFWLLRGSHLVVGFVFWGYRWEIFLWRPCFSHCLWRVQCSLCFRWFHLFGLFPGYADNSFSWFCCSIAKIRIFM